MDQDLTQLTTRGWNRVLTRFFQELGFTESIRGFEADFMVLNSRWEEQMVPGALARLIEGMNVVANSWSCEVDTSQRDTLLDERKLEYVHVSGDVSARSPTTINKQISSFLARHRVQNDASNRAEFLQLVAQKGRHSEESGTNMNLFRDRASSCARTDARMIDRDVQMKYDVAKNEDGPLRRTVKPPEVSSTRTYQAVPHEKGPNSRSVEPNRKQNSDPDRLFDERVANIESHFAIRYVPLSPKTVATRLKFLEDHIIQIEKDYPPWAALHFNQPKRGWPPSPRQTPIIVPSHLTPSSEPPSSSLAQPRSFSIPGQAVEGGKIRGTVSSLRRAVLEKLEVQKAMNDFSTSKSS